MKKNYIKKISFLFFLLVGLWIYSGSASAQVTIAQWGFDAESLTPDVGSGVAENIGGTTTAFAGGNPSTGKGWNTTPYPEQGTASATAGVQFAVSTAGYSAILVNWDNRNSNTAANRIRLQYTLNGTEWMNFEADADNAFNNALDGTPVGFDNGRYIANVGGSWFNRGASFSGITGANNNPSFAVRMVTEFGNGTEYLPSNPDGAYGTGGTIRFDNVTFAGGGGSAPMLSANPTTLSGFTYLEGNGPSDILITSISGSSLDPAAGDITVAVAANFEISLDGTTFSNSIMLPYSAGTLAATDVHVRMAAGLAAGNYAGLMTVNGGGAGELNVTLVGSVSSGMEPGLTNVILPQFIEGSVPNNNRVPFAYHATLENLLPNATYRYYNKVVISTDGATSNGAGNTIFVSPSGFTRTTGPSLATAGAYGELTTDADGMYSGWFITEPTGNASRFKPGTEIFMRIMLNDGNEGTTEALRLTTAEGVKVIAFNTVAADTTGTAIKGLSPFQPKNFVLLYDNTAGSGRPIYGTHVETSGVEFLAGTYAGFYATGVAAQDHMWGGIVPNMNPNGIKRVEERDILTGNIVSSVTSENGVWNGVDTKNPTGGLENVLIVNTTLGVDSPASELGKIYTYGKTLNIELNQRIDGAVQIINLYGQQVASYKLNETTSTYHLDVPAGVYIVRIVSNQGTASSKVMIR
jgi:hypothetical protein